MSWTKRIIAAVFVLAIVGIVAGSLVPKKDPPLTVQTSAVRRGAITRKVTAAGKLQAATQVKLSSNLSGDLLDLPVREGDQIKKGQYIGRIDSRRYEAQLHQREALEQSARSDLSMEEVNLARLAADVKRVERLVKQDSARAAELYGLKIIAREIEDNPHNFTRFFILSKEDSPPTGSDKTSIVFSLKHKPGALYDSLREFAERKINLTKLESRPTRHQVWEYNFYMDFSGHREEKGIGEALKALEEHAVFVKILGSYPRAR